MYLLGIDAGTSVVKAALFDRDGRELAAAARRTTLIIPQPGWAEADMTETWHMTCGAVRDLLAQTNTTGDQIAAVGITGQMVGAWLIDGRGEPVRNAILHIDSRTQPLIEQWGGDNFLAQVFEYSGAVMQPGCTLPLVAWLAKHDPDTLERAQHVLCCKDWLVYKLTGTIQLDPSEASVIPGDTRQRTYAEPLFDLMNVREHRDLFPSVVPSEQIVGEVHAAAADLTGLAPGTPVTAGAGDVLASSIGLGAVQAGAAYTLLGTACLNGLVTDAPTFEPRNIGLTFTQPGGRWVRMMLNVLGTPNLDWCIEQFFRDIPPENRFATLEAFAQESGIGANGVLYLPYLSPTGIFTPFVEPSARAEFFGLTVDHTRNDLLRAVYEGVALSIRDCYDTIPEAIDEIRLAGGGAKSAFWCQMIADVTGRRVLVPEGTEFGARGAAVLAGVGIGWYSDISGAKHTELTQRGQKCKLKTAPQNDINQAGVPIKHTYTPQNTQAYDVIITRYRELAQALRPVWRLTSRQAADSPQESN